LPHPLGISAHAAISLFRHADQFERFQCTQPRFTGGESAKACHGFDELPAGHFLVKTVEVRTVANVTLGLGAPGGVTEDLYGAQVGTELTGRQPHEGRFTGAVRPDQAGNPRPQFKRYLVNANDRTVPLGDMIEKQERRSLGVLCRGRLLRRTRKDVQGLCARTLGSPAVNLGYFTISTPRIRRFK
jgi:hypothetical protein